MGKHGRQIGKIRDCYRIVILLGKLTYCSLCQSGSDAFLCVGSGC